MKTAPRESFWRSCFRSLLLAAAGAIVFTLGTAERVQAQNCAFCEDCFHCGYDNDWGWEDCQNGGGACPCEGKGDPCGPVSLGLGTDFYRAVPDVYEDGAVRVKQALRLEGSVFGLFSCSDGGLIGVFREDGRGRLQRLPTVVLNVYRTKYHLSNYLDVTGALGRTGMASS